MVGRFRKLEVSNVIFSGGGGIFCNNSDQDKLYQFLQEHFGTPNGNFINQKETSWKYILEYEGYFITMYNFNDFWTIGFLEEEGTVVDYGKVYALSKMLFDYIRRIVYNECEPIKKSTRRRVKVGTAA